VKISCSIGFVERENDSGHLIESVSAVCSRCGHETFSFGTSDRSIRRCLVLMREDCPAAENNFYLSDADHDTDCDFGVDGDTVINVDADSDVDLE
jgi:hypothetical protein